MASSFAGARRLPATKHAHLMSAVFPGFRLRRRGAEFVWTGSVWPDDSCAVYTVQIKYCETDLPKVYVLNPKLIPRVGSDKIPHTYDGGTRLCLYTPMTGEWRNDKPISHTIVPWIALWLFHYEVWHATGEWLGGGHDPNTDQQERQAHTPAVAATIRRAST